MPEPRANEVLIKAEAFGVGQPDALIRKGVYKWMPPLPANPGNDLAGRIAGIGPGVSGFAAGQKVLLSARDLPQRGGCYAEYIAVPADAVHAVDGLFVLDCIASGSLWVDMQALGVDVLVSAPQKGWSGSPCCAFVMLGEEARRRIDGTTSSSFACDLRRWLQIMEAYENGGHAYHATMPTDALTLTRAAMVETRARGFETLRAQQWELGRRVRALVTGKGLRSVAADGWQAPGVVVSHTELDGLHSAKAFIAAGLQTAAGVPLMCDEPATFKTFRVGLFGLDKLANIDRTVASLDAALTRILDDGAAQRAA